MRILITQTKANPQRYASLKALGWTLHFHPFIEANPNSLTHKQHLQLIEQHSAFVFTSHRAVDYFFTDKKELLHMRARDLRHKYFCISEALAQRVLEYAPWAHANLYIGQGTAQDLCKTLEKHPKERFLYLCTPNRLPTLPRFFAKKDLNYHEYHLYHSKPVHLSHLRMSAYDLVIFYSPSGAKALHAQQPDFKPHRLIIAALGNTTANTIKNIGWPVHIVPKKPTISLLINAIEGYFKPPNDR